MALEPLYSLDVAAELVPCDKKALEYILSSRRDQFDEPTYFCSAAVNGPNHPTHGAAYRMLRESEVLKIREIVTKPTHGRSRLLTRQIQRSYPTTPTADNVWKLLTGESV